MGLSQRGTQARVPTSSQRGRSLHAGRQSDLSRRRIHDRYLPDRRRRHERAAASDGELSGKQCLPEPDGPGQYAAARRILAEDPATGAAAEPVFAEPSADTWLGVELAVPSLAAVAGAVAWLPTKVNVRIKRKDGKTEFEFRVVKEAAPAALLKEVAAAVVRLWSRPPQQ